MSRPANPDTKVRMNLSLPSSIAAQLKLLAYDPGTGDVAYSQLFIEVWALYLRQRRERYRNAGYTYIPPPEDLEMTPTQNIMDMRARVLAGETISIEEYKEAIALLREDRLKVHTTSTDRKSGAKTKVALPQNLNDLFDKPATPKELPKP